MVTAVYDIVIVGAGLMGSAAAYYAAKQGKSVLVLEQFELLHSKGSSHGSSRIFRVAYPNDIYTKMSLQSLKISRTCEMLSCYCEMLLATVCQCPVPDVIATAQDTGNTSTTDPTYNPTRVYACTASRRTGLQRAHVRAACRRY